MPLGDYTQQSERRSVRLKRIACSLRWDTVA